MGLLSNEAQILLTGTKGKASAASNSDMIQHLMSQVFEKEKKESFKEFLKFSHFLKAILCSELGGELRFHSLSFRAQHIINF